VANRVGDLRALPVATLLLKTSAMTDAGRLGQLRRAVAAHGAVRLTGCCLVGQKTPGRPAEPVMRGRNRFSMPFPFTTAALTDRAGSTLDWEFRVLTLAGDHFGDGFGRELLAALGPGRLHSGDAIRVTSRRRRAGRQRDTTGYATPGTRDRMGRLALCGNGPRFGVASEAAYRQMLAQLVRPAVGLTPATNGGDGADADRLR